MQCPRDEVATEVADNSGVQAVGSCGGGMNDGASGMPVKVPEKDRAILGEGGGVGRTLADIAGE